MCGSSSFYLLCVWGVQKDRFANLANNLPKWYNLVRHGYKAPDPRLFQHRPTACCETASRFVVSAAAVAPPPSPLEVALSHPADAFHRPPTPTGTHPRTTGGYTPASTRQQCQNIGEDGQGDGWWLQEKSGGRLALRVTSRLLPRAWRGPRDGDVDAPSLRRPAAGTCGQRAPVRSSGRRWRLGRGGAGPRRGLQQPAGDPGSRPTSPAHRPAAAGREGDSDGWGEVRAPGSRPRSPRRAPGHLRARWGSSGGRGGRAAKQG